MFLLTLGSVRYSVFKYTFKKQQKIHIAYELTWKRHILEQLIYYQCYRNTLIITLPLSALCSLLMYSKVNKNKTADHYTEFKLHTHTHVRTRARAAGNLKSMAVMVTH